MARELTPMLAEMDGYLSGFDVDDEYRAERDSYLQAHLRRLKVTLDALPPAAQGGTLLELGAAPYAMTCLLKRYTAYELCVTGYFPGQAARVTVNLRNSSLGEEHALPCYNLNVEADPLPFAEGSFDVVMCCELLEHLLFDPTHMLVEIHRVLKRGGRVLITTPNVLVLRNVNALLRKRQNIYAPYSGYGPYGRHNREWTLDEVVQLCRGCGYRIERAAVVDTYPHRGYSAWLKRLFPHLRDMICVVAAADGEARAYYPDTLYVAMHPKPGAAPAAGG